MGLLNRWPHNSHAMGAISFLLLGACTVGALSYLPSVKEPSGLNEAFFQDMVDHMGRDLDNYFDDMSGSDSLLYPQLMSRSYKDLTDYQDSPIPRDQEYLHHSSLWGNGLMQGSMLLKPSMSYLYLANTAKNENGMLGEKSGLNSQQGNKPDTLPAYCNPPNPCPIGFSGEEGCLEEFENTAAFSREYQARQDCMCDSEHMFDCPNNQNGNEIPRTDLDQLVEDERKSLVAKKYHAKKSVNPYLEGEKLPIAAKKGINVGF